MGNSAASGRGRLILTGIVFALFTISNVLGVMFMRVRVLTAIIGQQAGGSQ